MKQPSPLCVLVATAAVLGACSAPDVARDGPGDSAGRTAPATVAGDSVGDSARNRAELTVMERADTRPRDPWPSFRGVRAAGIAHGPGTPTDWDVATGRNVAWSTPVPGLAHSSPIVWGERLFVSTAVRADGPSELSSLYGSPGYGAGESVADEGTISYRLYCLDKSTGDVLWSREAHQGMPRTKRHPKASHANATPACDGERVVVSFGSEGLYCYDHDGGLLWSRDLGVLNVGAPGYPDKDGYQWGFASSPILHDDRVIVQCDHEGESFLACLDVADGTDVWRVTRDEDSTWSTPNVHVGADGNAQVLVNGYRHIGGYDLATGAEVWRLEGGGDVPVPTPVVAHDLIFLTSAHGRSAPLRAVRADAVGDLGTGDAVEGALAWNLPRRGVYMQTPLVYDGLVYACSDGGILGCYDALTGEELYRERLGSGTGGFSGSPVASDGVLYLSGEAGDIHVVRAGPVFEVLAVNDMGETCMATPAISEGTLYVRTRGRVVAIR